jgi:hypothetical protein
MIVELILAALCLTSCGVAVWGLWRDEWAWKALHFLSAIICGWYGLHRAHAGVEAALDAGQWLILDHTGLPWVVAACGIAAAWRLHPMLEARR